ncbi:MAG: histidinol-phosphate transaminase [Betaproteobacteria bacterium]|nr:histidinol-phosphate transaminase [Betaproteobacteria bacterium]
MAIKPESLIRPEILDLKAYHVPPARGMVKLDAMENPYGLPEDLQREVGAIAGEAALNRYPDPGAGALKARLREVLALPRGMEVLLGNGSDEVIQIIALACAKPGAVILSVEPTFVMFRMIATFAGTGYVGVPLREDFSLDAEATVAALEAHRPAVVFLAYPNNPTGNLFDEQAMERIIESAPGLVVVDEAYHAFAGASFLDRLARFPNLLVMRTLSKLGLAGLRLGLLAGRGEWIEQFEKLRLPYNVSTLTQAVAERVLGRGDVLADQAAAIRREREALFSTLQGIAGVTTYPSRANFILFRVNRADDVFRGLKSHGVLIKNLHGSHPMLAGCLRVTVGTPEENGLFVAALGKCLAETRAA